MSCDRESVTSCQDLLAMSQTRRYSYWVHQRFGLVCQLSRWAGPSESRIRGKQTAATTFSHARADA